MKRTHLLLFLFLISCSCQKFKLVKNFITPRIYNVNGAAILPLNHTVLLLSDGVNALSVVDDTLFYDIFHSTDKLLSFALDPRCSATLENCNVYIHTVNTNEMTSIHTISSLILRLNYTTLYTDVSDMHILYSTVREEASVQSGTIVIDRQSQYLFFDVGGQMMRISISSCTPYCIPQDNPFSNETFAIGINSPSHCYFDKILFRMVCVEISGQCGDSIYVVYPRSDYGAPTFSCGECGGMCSYPRYFEFPSAVYNVAGGSRSGYVYRGSRATVDFFNRYILLANNKIYKSTSVLRRNIIAGMQEIKVLDDPVHYRKNYMFQDGSGELYVIGNDNMMNGVFVFTFISG